MERPPAEPTSSPAETAAPAPAEPAKRRKKQQTIGPGTAAPEERTYEGVSREDGVWVADIKFDGEEIKRLGTYENAGAAAWAYDGAREERGLPPVNFPLPGQASPAAEAPAPAADEEAAPTVEPLTTPQQRAVDTRLRGAKAEERLALHAKLTADKVPENLVAEQVSALFNRQKAEAEAAVRAEMAEAVAARAIVDAVATEKSRAQPAYPATCEMSDQAIIDELIHVWGYKESTLRTSRNGAWRARASLACWLRQERGEGKAGHPAPATYPAHYGMAPAQSDPSTADVPSETAVAPISASATQQSSLPAAWPKSGLTERPAAPTPRPPASAAAAPMRAKQPLDAAAPRRSGRTAPRSYTDFSDRDAPKLVAPGPATPRPHVNLHAMTADGVAPTSVAECALASQPATDPASLALQAQIDKTIVAKVAGREIPNVFAAACGTQLRQVVVTAGGMRCAICALAYSPYVGYVGDKGTKFQAQKAHCGHWNSSNRNERTLAHLDRLLALTSSSPVDRLKALAPVALPPEVELVVPPEQVQAEVRRARADGWRVEGSSYLGRTVRRTILSETGRPLSCSDGVIRGWLDASRSDFVDSAGRPAALWHVYLATGELAGDEVDLEFSEVLESLVAPPAPPAPAPPPPAAACPEPRPKLPPAPKLDKTNESLWLPRRGDACYSLWRGAWYPAKIVTVVSPDSYEVHYPGWGTQHNHATSRKCLRHKDYDFDLDAHDAPRPAALWTRKPPPCAAEPQAEAPSRKRPRPDDATADSARLRKELDALRAASQRLEQDLRASEARAAELSKQNETTEASILVARRDADEARARATSERQRGDRLEQDLRSQTDLADRYGRQRDEARRAAAALRADVAQLRRERDESRADAAALREKLDDLPRVTPARPAKRGRHSPADEPVERTEEPADEARDVAPRQVVEGDEDNAWPIVGSHVQRGESLRGVVTKLGYNGVTEVTTKTGYAVNIPRKDLTPTTLSAEEAALCDRSRLAPNEWLQAQLDGAVCAVYEGRSFGNCFATKDGRTQRTFTVGTNGDVRCALCDWTAPARASAAMQNDLSAWRKWVDAIKSHCGQFASALKQPATRRHVENVLAMAAEPSTQRDEASPSPTATTDAEVEARDEPVDEARDAALARRLQAEEDAAARPEEEETQLATRPSAKARQEAAAAKAAAYEKARAEEIARTGIAQPPKRPSIPRGLAPSRPDAMGPSNVLRPPTAPRRAAPFPVDSLVEARWRGGRMTYPARVVAVRRNEVDLKYLDGDEEKGVSVALVQPASQRVIARYRAVDTARRPATLPPAPAPAAAAPAKPRAFAKGDQVVAPWSDGRRYAATVVSVGATSTRVAFEDGSQHSVPSDQLESPRLFQKDDAAAAAATPAPTAAGPWQQGVRALSAAVDALREKTPRIGLGDLHDTLESHGFSFARDYAKPPEHFPSYQDLVGKDYKDGRAIRSVPQLMLYLERALGLCDERPAPPPPKRAPAPPKKPPKKKRARVEAPAAEPCPICLEPLDAAAPALSACGHRIHADCLAGADGSLVSHAWADSKTRTRKGQKVLCPTCRTPSWVAPL